MAEKLKNPPALCGKCRGIEGWYGSISKEQSTPKDRDPRYCYTHHTSYDALTASAIAGCNLCDLFSYDFQLYPIREYRTRNKIASWEKISRDVDAHLRSWEGSTGLELTCLNDDGVFSTYGIFYRVGESIVTGALPFGSIIPFENMRRYPEARFAQAWKWLDSCDQNHPNCSSPDPSYVPTRLLDVGDNPTTETLRLVDTTKQWDRLTNSKYVALSYCWGLSMPSSGMTTKTSLNSHLQGIDSKDLPRTLQDAVQITRELGIRYLWIDALCIIQNSAPDWQHESGAMSAIYSNAYCTIAAASTPHCSGGILIPQDRRQILSVNLGRFSLKASTPSHRDLRDASPLSTRAWALQERELSPRILWFTKHMLIFECRRIWASEEQPRGHDHSYNSSGVRDRSLNIFSGRDISRQPMSLRSPELGAWAVVSNTTHDSDALGEMYMAWRAIVEQYSGRQLSRATDKLPALSGLAHEVQNCVESGYAAGLWHKDILRGLLWRRRLRPQRDITQKNKTKSWSPESSSILPTLRTSLTDILASVNLISPAPEPPSRLAAKSNLNKASYIAPSWSWASKNFPVDYRVAGQSRRKDPAPPSQSLNATLVSISISLAGSDAMGEVLSGSLKLTGWIRSLRDWLAKPRESWHEEMIRWDSDDENHGGVLILSLMRDDPHYEDVPAYNGILIKETEEEGHYHRVGLIKTVHASWLAEVQRRVVVLV